MVKVKRISLKINLKKSEILFFAFPPLVLMDKISPCDKKVFNVSQNFSTMMHNSFKLSFNEHELFLLSPTPSSCAECYFYLNKEFIDFFA